MIADGAAQHGVACFERVKDGALGNGGWDFKLDFTLDAGEET